MEKQLTLSSSLGTINCFKTDNDNVLCSLETVTTVVVVNKTNTTVYITSNVIDQKLNKNSIEEIEANETKEIVCRRLIGDNKDLIFTTNPKLFKKIANGEKNVDGVYNKITTDEKVFIIQKGKELSMVKRYGSLTRLKSSVINTQMSKKSI